MSLENTCNDELREIIKLHFSSHLEMSAISEDVTFRERMMVNFMPPTRNFKVYAIVLRLLSLRNVMLFNYVIQVLLKLNKLCKAAKYRNSVFI